MHGAEERDALFGRIFTCASVLRSGRLASLPSGRCASLAASISKELAYCANKKSFLQELCATLQCTLIDTLPIDQVQSAVWPNISPLLTVPLAEWSAHALLLAFRLCRKLPPATLTALLPHVSLHKGQLLSLTNLPALVGPLKTASVAHPRLHAVWDDILDHGLTTSTTSTAAAPASAPTASGPVADEGSPSKKGKKAKKAAAAAANGNGNGGAVAPEEASSSEVTNNSIRPIDDGLLRAFWQTVVELSLIHI